MADRIRVLVAGLRADVAWSLMMDLPGGLVEAQRLLSPDYVMGEERRDADCRRHVLSELLDLPHSDAIALLEEVSRG